MCHFFWRDFDELHILDRGHWNGLSSCRLGCRLGSRLAALLGQGLARGLAALGAGCAAGLIGGFNPCGKRYASAASCVKYSFLLAKMLANLNALRRRLTGVFRHCKPSASSAIVGDRARFGGAGFSSELHGLWLINGRG